MSEKTIVANCNLVCDLCGGIIPRGSKCRLVKDDFMPDLIYFEHLRCPPLPGRVTADNKPTKPAINKSQRALA